MDCARITSKPTWCAGSGAVLILLLALVIGLLVFVIVRCNKKLQSKKEQTPLLSDQTTNSETGGIAMSGALTFAPMKGAFMIPFEQLEVGQVIALGAQGQVRKGFFSGKAVAIKELLSVMFNPEETTALKV